VEKFVGDAVMAVFGAPVAHEDDPERAVRAGLRILKALE
jgi:adenylate cyclase